MLVSNLYCLDYCTNATLLSPFLALCTSRLSCQHGNDAEALLEIPGVRGNVRVPARDRSYARPKASPAGQTVPRGSWNDDGDTQHVWERGRQEKRPRRQGRGRAEVTIRSQEWSYHGECPPGGLTQGWDSRSTGGST